MDEQKSAEIQGLTIESIVNECKKGKGFVIFVGVLTNKKDNKDNLIIDFHYLRNHYSLEDLEIYLTEAKKALKNDILQIQNNFS